MEKVMLVENSLLQDALYFLRDKNTTSEMFRYHSDRLCSILLSHAFSSISVQDAEMETPLTKAKNKKLNIDVLLLPILRAGLSMLPHALRFLPSAKVGFAGLARDEQTARAHEYYWNVPKLQNDDSVFILDPMLATGGSILYVLEKLHKENITRVSVVSVIAAPEGITAIHNIFQDVKIFVGAIDEKLNDNKYIVPGLGDYGDRYFGTE